MIGNKLSVLIIVFALLAIGLVSASDIKLVDVEFDGDTLNLDDVNSIQAYDRDNSYDVKVRVELEDNFDDIKDELKDAQIEVYMRGYDHNDLIQDISDAFDMEEGVTYKKTLTLKLRYRMDKDEYDLRIRVEGRSGDGLTRTFKLKVESEKHAMLIKDVVFSPSNAVLAGRSLLTSVRIKNTGMDDDKEGVRVSVAIPELGIEATDYIDEIDNEESVTSEELYLRIPPCTKGGVYDAVIKVVYDDGDETKTLTKQITILEDEQCNAKDNIEEKPQPKTIITVGPTTQDVARGEGGVIYPLTLSNAGSDSQTYVISADGYATWADLSISPQNIVNIGPGEAKALYVYLTAKPDTQAGERMFSLKVTSGTETVKEFTLKANVIAGKEEASPTVTNWASIKRVLEIGLVVLVVLLVILGLIIGFSRLKGDDDMDDDDGKSETYY